MQLAVLSGECIVANGTVARPRDRGLLFTALAYKGFQFDGPCSATATKIPLSISDQLTKVMGNFGQSLAQIANQGMMSRCTSYKQARVPHRFQITLRPCVRDYAASGVGPTVRVWRQGSPSAVF